MKFFIIFRHWADVFGLLSIFWRVCWNYILRVHRNTLGKKMFFKIYSFPIFLDKKRIFFSELCRNKFGGVIKNEFCRSKEKLLGHFFSKVILPIFFGHWPKVPRGFLRKFSASLSKLDSLFQRKLSEKKFFSAKFTICFFLENRAGKFRLTVGKYSGGFEAAFYLSRGTFRKKRSWKNFASFVDIFFDHFR